MSKTGFYDADAKRRFCEALLAANGPQVTRAQVLDHASNSGQPIPYWFLNDTSRRVNGNRGVYNVVDTKSRNVSATNPLSPELFSSNTVSPSEQAVAMTATVTPIRRFSNMGQVTENLIPDKDPTYVEFGDFSSIEKIIKSKIFYPVYIVGLSGNGKTMSIEQACAKLKRECIRVNITDETDEDDLVGGNTLIDGNIVYREGPVLTAMRRGAVLILDEVDLNAVKIMCLQSILEGKPYQIKKTGEKVFPAVGFNVFATANTKGRGSEDGKFVGAKYMNEAFLERFPITIEQQYPPEKVETKILFKNMKKFGITDDGFVDNLIKWANVIRKSYEDGAASDIISTRRLVHIISAYAIFSNRLTAVKMCLNRFDAETKNSFYDLYTKIDGDVNPNPQEESTDEQTGDSDSTQ